MVGINQVLMVLIWCGFIKRSETLTTLTILVTLTTLTTLTMLSRWPPWPKRVFKVVISGKFCTLVFWYIHILSVHQVTYQLMAAPPFICGSVSLPSAWFSWKEMLFHLYLAMIWSPPSGAPDPAPLNVGGGGCAHQSLRLWHAAAPDLPLHLHLADMEYKCRKICAILYFKDKIAMKCQNNQY